jgi:hypothetical protein
MTEERAGELLLPETARDRWDYLPRFVGPNWELYRPVAESLQNGKPALSWSWSAFLFTELWLAYRRRFSWTALFIGFTMVAGTAFGSNGGEYAICASRILIAVFGKSLYLREALRRIDKIIATVPDASARMKRVDRAGGVDENAVIVVILLMLASSAALFWYLFPYMEQALESITVGG